MVEDSTCYVLTLRFTELCSQSIADVYQSFTGVSLAMISFDEVCIVLNTCGNKFIQYCFIVKPAKAARAWFLEIALVRASVCVCVCVCVSAPEAINNHWCDMV